MRSTLYLLAALESAVALFGLSLVLTGLFIGLSLAVSRRFLWPAALCSWVLSFLGAWSIGLYTLALTLVLLVLAVAHELGLLRRPLQVVAAVVGGVLLWALLVATVDDSWLFFPLNEILQAVFGS